MLFLLYFLATFKNMKNFEAPFEYKVPVRPMRPLNPPQRIDQLSHSPAMSTRSHSIHTLGLFEQGVDQRPKLPHPRDERDERERRWVVSASVGS